MKLDRHSFAIAQNELSRADASISGRERQQNAKEFWKVKLRPFGRKGSYGHSKSPTHCVFGFRGVARSFAAIVRGFEAPCNADKCFESLRASKFRANSIFEPHVQTRRKLGQPRARGCSRKSYLPGGGIEKPELPREP